MPTPPALSSPRIPEGMILLRTWCEANQIGLATAHQWVARGRFVAYRVPGYGRRSFIKKAEADAALTAIQITPAACK